MSSESLAWSKSTTNAIEKSFFHIVSSLTGS
jgi:hypothetical protein